MSIFYALTLIKRTISAYPVAQGNIINYLFEERHIMQNSEKSKIDIIADILRTVLLRIVQEQKIAG